MRSLTQRTSSMQPIQPSNDIMGLPQQAHQIKLEFQKEDHECYLSPATKQYLDFLKKIISQFLNKYLQHPTELELDFALVKFEKIREQTFKQKGTRELAAVVVYCQYPDQIRLGIKQFCLRNQLNLKLFHRKYKAYRKIFKQIATENTTSCAKDTVKIEEKVQQTEKQEDNPGLTQYEPHFVHVNNPKQAIELIFDGIFKSQYFQEKRRETIDKMANRCMEIDRRILDLMDWTNNYTVRLYYAIFVFLKQLGMPVSFLNYREAVYERTGYSLYRRFSWKTLCLFRQISSQDQQMSGSESN